MSDGVIWVATGAAYLDLAAQSARSLRDTNPGLATLLFTDRPADAPPDLFDRVLPVPRAHARAKIDCLPLSPFGRTLYLDCDTLVLGPLDAGFALLDRFDLAAAHDVRRATPLIREGAEEDTPDAFPQLNSGVLFWRRSAATAAFLADWQARYARAGHLRDQITLKDLLWAGDLRFYVLPPEWNLRRTPMLDAWEPGDAIPRILHSHRLLDHVRRAGAPRLSTLEDVVAAERAALADEWAAQDLAPGSPEARAAMIADGARRRG